ncbi:MAG: hypothetical protein AAGC88_06380 [Bacteroidota bacterium]
MTILLGAFLFLGSFIRIGLNAHIYNVLHNSDKRLFVTKGEPGGGEDESIESGLFLIYCLLVIFWVKYRKDIVMRQMASNLLGLMSLMAVVYLVIS